MIQFRYRYTKNPQEGHTSSEESTLGPVHRQHTTGAKTDALGEIDAAPEVHGNDAAAEAHAAKVEDSGVADVCQAAEMPVLESAVDSLVEIAVVDLIGLETGEGRSNLAQLVAQVDTLLVGALGGGRERSKLCVDLAQELGELIIIQGAGVVFVVLLEEAVRATEMV